MGIQYSMLISSICSQMLIIGRGRKWSSGNFCVDNYCKVRFVLVCSSQEVGLSTLPTSAPTHATRLVSAQCRYRLEAVCVLFSVLCHRAPLLDMKRKRIRMLTVPLCVCVLFPLCVVCLYECTCGFPMKCSFWSTELRESMGLAAVSFECIKQHLQSWAMIDSKQTRYHFLRSPKHSGKCGGIIGFCMGVYIVHVWVICSV